MTISRRKPSASRNGVSLMELIVSCGVIVGLVSVLIPTVQRYAQVRNDLAMRDLAIRELRNLAEQGLSGTPHGELKLSEWSTENLKGAALVIDTTWVDDPPLQEVRMSLRWQNSVGEMTAATELRYWQLASEGERR